MKCRNGFVSNSSSSSFIIKKANITDDQLEMIRDHPKVAEKRFPEHYFQTDCPWDIDETEATIYCSVFMDNFDMGLFLELIDVSPDDIICCK